MFKKIAFSSVSFLGFCVSLYFSAYTLTLYAGNDEVMVWVFIAFAFTLQFASVLFAVLTSVSNKWYIIPTVIMALLNIFATTSFGVSTFGAEYENVTGQDEYKTALIAERDVLIDDIEKLKKEREGYPEAWAWWRDQVTQKIDEKQEKVSELNDRIFKPAEKIETREAVTPVTMYTRVSEITGIKPTTSSILYYSISAIMLEVIVTVFAGVAAATGKSKDKKPPEPAKRPALHQRPAVSKSDVLHFVKLALPHVLKYGALPKDEQLSMAGVDMRKKRDILDVLNRLEIIDIKGDKVTGSFQTLPEAIETIKNSSVKKE